MEDKQSVTPLFRFGEALGVILNLLYTFFYLRENPVCYVFGVTGPALFILLCMQRKLYAEVVLQVVYVGLALYGWWNLGQGQWQEGVWTSSSHYLLLTACAGSIIVAGFALKRFTDARLPFLDTTTTVLGIAGTWVMVNYVHANWLYFIAVNLLSIVLYTRRRMWIAGTMYVVYLLMAIDGYFRLQWFYA